MSGSAKVVDELYEYYYTGINGEDIDQTTRSPNLPSHIKFSAYDVASVFKRFLAALPGGILGSLPVLDALVAVHSQLNCGPELSRTRETKLRARLIALIIGSISSQYQRELICAVFGLLSLVGRTAETAPREDSGGHPLPTGDLMGYNALGIVFGPLLIGDLLDSYIMKLADPSAGLVLFPVTPSKAKKPRYINRPRKHDKSKMEFEDSQASLTIDKLHEMSGITEMVITNWRDVVRHMRSLDVLKTRRHGENRGPTRREHALRSSASESAIASKPRAWSGRCPSADEVGRSASAAGADISASSTSAVRAGPSSEQKRPQRTGSATSSQKKPCPLSPTVEEGVSSGFPSVEPEQRGEDESLALSQPSLKEDAGEQPAPPANTPIPSLDDAHHPPEISDSAPASDKPKIPRRPIFHRRRRERARRKLFPGCENHIKKHQAAEPLDVAESEQVDEEQAVTPGQDEEILETKKFGGRIPHYPRRPRPQDQDPTPAGQASVHFDDKTMPGDEVAEREQDTDNASFHSKSSKSKGKELANGKRQAESTDTLPADTTVGTEDLSLLGASAASAGEGELGSQRSVESLPKSAQLKEKRRLRGAAARFLARQISSSDGLAAASTGTPVRGIPALKRNLYTRLGEARFKHGKLADEAEGTLETHPPPPTETSDVVPESEGTLAVPAAEADVQEAGDLSTASAAEPSSVPVGRTAEDDLSQGTTLRLEVPGSEQFDSVSQTSGSTHSLHPDGDHLTGAGRQVAGSTKSQPLRSSTPKGVLKSAISETNLRVHPLRRKAKGILMKVPRGLLYPSSHGQVEVDPVVEAELFDQPSQSQKVVHPPKEDGKISAQQEPESGLQEVESLQPKRARAYMFYGPHKGYHTASEKGKGKAKDKVKDKDEKRRFLAHRIRRSPKSPESEASIPTADEYQTPESEEPAAEPLEVAGPSEPIGTADSSPATQAEFTDANDVPAAAETKDNDISRALPQRQPSTGSNSVLHAQVRSLGRQLEARTEEAAQLRRRLEAREMLDAGTGSSTGPLSEQLRRSRCEAAAWRRRAEAAERRVVILARFTARLKALQDAETGAANETSVGGCPCPCSRPGDVGSADGAAAVHAEGDFEVWHLDTPPLNRSRWGQKTRTTGPGGFADPESTAELWDAALELLQGQERLDREGL